MTTITILTILAIHWFADFYMQSDWMAQNKSKSWRALISHTLVYSTITAALWGFVFPAGHLGFENFIYVFIITLIAHTITDYFTSRLNSLLWEKKEVHWFFISIGFDQLLHYAQLFFMYELLTR